MAATTLTYEDRKISSSNNGSNTAAHGNGIYLKNAGLSPSFGSWSTRGGFASTRRSHITFFFSLFLCPIFVYLFISLSLYLSPSITYLPLFFASQFSNHFSLSIFISTSSSIFLPFTLTSVTRADGRRRGREATTRRGDR